MNFELFFLIGLKSLNKQEGREGKEGTDTKSQVGSGVNDRIEDFGKGELPICHTYNP